MVGQAQQPKLGFWFWVTSSVIVLGLFVVALGALLFMVGTFWQ